MVEEYILSASRTSELLDAYGADPAHWPADKRAAMLECIASSPELQQQQQSITRLDVLLVQDNQRQDLSSVDLARLHARIINAVPVQPTRRHNWLGRFVDQCRDQFKRPMYVTVFASLLLVITSVGLLNWQNTDPSVTSDNTVVSAYDEWMLQQMTGQAVEQAATETAPADYMTLVELELDS